MHLWLHRIREPAQFLVFRGFGGFHFRGFGHHVREEPHHDLEILPLVAFEHFVKCLLDAVRLTQNQLAHERLRFCGDSVGASFRSGHSLGFNILSRVLSTLLRNLHSLRILFGNPS